MSEQIPPHDLDAEAAVVSSCMLYPDAIDIVRDFLKPEHYYSESHRRIYEACLYNHDQHLPADIVLVAQRLKAIERIAQVGGMAYLTGVLGAAPEVRRVEHYARIVFDKYRHRSMIAVCQRLGAQGYTHQDAVDLYLAEAESAVSAIASDTSTQARGTMLDTSLRSTYQAIVDTYERGVPNGIPTGFDEYDEKTIGLHRGEVTVIAARPGMGKSALAFGVVFNVVSQPPPLFSVDGAPAQKIGAGVFSVEMPEDQFTMRAMSAEARVSLQRLRSGKLDEDHWAKLSSAANRMMPWPIYVDDTPSLHISALRARVRRLKTEYARRGIDLAVVVIDYLQLMSGEGENVRSREQEIAVISRGVRLLAKEENISILLVAQLNRDLEKRADKRPILADLRESGSIEQDAHNIVFIYRPEVYGQSVHADERGITELIIAKQRNGPTGVARVRWTGRYTRFDNFGASAA